MKTLLLILLLVPMMSFGQSKHEISLCVDDAPFLNSGLWLEDCDIMHPEVKYVRLDKKFISLGVEGAFGGTIEQIKYNTITKEFKIVYINDNDMAGDGSRYSFLFSYSEKKIIFQESMLSPNYDSENNNTIIFYNCGD